MLRRSAVVKGIRRGVSGALARSGVARRRTRSVREGRVAVPAFSGHAVSAARDECAKTAMARHCALPITSGTRLERGCAHLLTLLDRYASSFDDRFAERWERRAGREDAEAWRSELGERGDGRRLERRRRDVPCKADLALSVHLIIRDAGRARFTVDFTTPREADAHVTLRARWGAALDWPSRRPTRGVCCATARSARHLRDIREIPARCAPG